jgi:hypothetical protein
MTMSSITVEIGGFKGTAESMKRATERAIRQADSALRGTYAPEIIEWRGNAILVARDPVGGWGQRVIMDNGKLRAGWQSMGSEASQDMTPDDARKDAIRAAKRHLAQMGWSQADGYGAPDILSDKSDRADHETWARWQLRMKALCDAGVPDDRARRIEFGIEAWPTEVPVPCERY